MSRMWHRTSRIDHLPGAGVKRRSLRGTPCNASLSAVGVATSVSRWRARSFTLRDVVSGIGGSRRGHALSRFREEQFLGFQARQECVENERSPFPAADRIEREVGDAPDGKRLVDGAVDLALECQVQ